MLHKMFFTEVGSRGFPLPKVDNIKFVNSELRILQVGITDTEG